MRALAVHEDVIVVVSSIWQTTCTAVRSGDEGFLIDSPVLPAELEALPALLEQSHFPVSGLLATHGDWDHLLGRLAFAEHSLGVGESTAARLEAELGEPQRRLREFDNEFYVEGRRPLALTGLQGLPVPGRISIGSDTVDELELLPADGHTGDGVCFWLPWASVLICGDYLSPVELPMISAEHGGSLEAYRETLFRLSPLVNRAQTVVPGHGAPLTAERALELLAEDLAYLEQLAGDGEVTLPSGRRSATQREIHARNLAAVR
ncbi:MBL fold metallo-hydrolase [Conexibacter sp. S30A1]|uniref:MBL fold metallo-hydrolase n=1 Tax=Conexibacter sp. S30A1 TaxID=2937800 RepID=UPI00200CC00B|nr:MBL fold metallo-hydrolase [Conexibacter sp. S30A1]